MSKIFLPALTNEILNSSYRAWQKEYGNGRGNGDLRFGQWIMNNWSHPNAVFPRLFYCESAVDAYNMIYQEINP